MDGRMVMCILADGLPQEQGEGESSSESESEESEEVEEEVGLAGCHSLSLSLSLSQALCKHSCQVVLAKRAWVGATRVSWPEGPHKRRRTSVWGSARLSKAHMESLCLCLSLSLSQSQSQLLS